MTGHIRNRLPVVERGLSVLDPRRKSEEEFVESFELKRTKYAAMQAHREMSAQVLAVGGTFKMAALRAGVSVRQVKKYYEDADYRQRIEELRTVMLSKVRGRVMTELSRRTEPAKIRQIELLDLLRVFDRVNGAVGQRAGITVGGDINVNQYDTIIAALLSSEPRAEGVDFPIIEVESTALPSADT